MSCENSLCNRSMVVWIPSAISMLLVLVIDNECAAITATFATTNTNYTNFFGGDEGGLTELFNKLSKINQISFL